MATHCYHPKDSAYDFHPQTKETKFLNSEPKNLAKDCHQLKESANDFHFNKKSKKVKNNPQKNTEGSISKKNPNSECSFYTYTIGTGLEEPLSRGVSRGINPCMKETKSDSKGKIKKE